MMLGLGKWTKKILDYRQNRLFRDIYPLVDAINALESEKKVLSDAALKACTKEFRGQLAEGKTLDSILVPAFATVREAAKRVLGMRHFDVQLKGGIVLHRGNIAEMRTGEGKTLVATLPVYLNALSGRGVHVVTVNDYLAKRDSEWMGKLYDFLGLKTGIIVQDLSDEERRNAYHCDVTYATNNELGFDYLRDNMKYEHTSMVQRGHHYAIIDEVDSILIDEARTPLIISGPSDDHSQTCEAVDKLILCLEPSDYEIDEKLNTSTFTETGAEKLEKMLDSTGLLKGNSLYSIENIGIVHSVNNALKAHHLFQRDKDYIVHDDAIMIIDEFTGRMMQGRRYSEGLHQALEAKEHVTVHPENQTLASITFQNYFRMYTHLAGMTGTARTEAEEFEGIYNLGVIPIPTNMPVRREDADDEIYRTKEEKYAAIITEIRAANKKGQPVLAGTTSIEKSEDLASRLEKEGIKNFQVLNARYHEQEAMIIAQAGCPGAITIATNMAGRGTDIRLGGNEEMRIQKELEGISEGPERTEKERKIREEVGQLRDQAITAGGLYVLATERHESRRIDNQLRGRSGRQGDPGYSKFYLSLEDDLMRIFGSARIDSMLGKFGLKENEAIIHPWINKALEKAQKKVEARNFEIRKNLLKYDNVMNDQRKVVFDQRLALMKSQDVHETILQMRDDVLDEMITRFIPENSWPVQWDMEGLEEAVHKECALDIPARQWAMEEGIAEQEIRTRLGKAVEEATHKRTQGLSPETMASLERTITLQTLDHLWREHLMNLDHLRSTVGLRGYGQRDPLHEYKAEAFEFFQIMLSDLKQSVTRQLMHIECINDDSEIGRMESDSQMVESQNVLFHAQTQESETTPGTRQEKIARNQFCPCGSGKKYKHCHGAWNQE